MSLADAALLLIASGARGGAAAGPQAAPTPSAFANLTGQGGLSGGTAMNKPGLPIDHLILGLTGSSVPPPTAPQTANTNPIVPQAAPQVPAVKPFVPVLGQIYTPAQQQALAQAFGASPIANELIAAQGTVIARLTPAQFIAGTYVPPPGYFVVQVGDSYEVHPVSDNVVINGRYYIKGTQPYLQALGLA